MRWFCPDVKSLYSRFAGRQTSIFFSLKRSFQPPAAQTHLRIAKKLLFLPIFSRCHSKEFFYFCISQSYGHICEKLSLRASERKVWSSKLYKYTSGIRQEGHPKFKVLRCSKKSLVRKRVRTVVEIH